MLGVSRQYSYIVLAVVLVCLSHSYEWQYTMSQCILGTNSDTILDWRCDVDRKSHKILCQQPNTPHFSNCYMSVSHNITILFVRCLHIVHRLSTIALLFLKSKEDGRESLCIAFSIEMIGVQALLEPNLLKVLSEFSTLIFCACSNQGI